MAASMACKQLRISQRYKHLYLVKPCVNYSSATVPRKEEQVVSYPPVKPRFPPGNWGNMTEKSAWKRHDKMNEVNQLETVTERIKYLTEPNIRYRKLPTYMRKTKLLEYQTFITKTHVMAGLPADYSNDVVDPELLNQTKTLIEDMLLLEYDKLHRHQQFRSHRLNEQQMVKDMTFVKNMLNSLLPMLFKHNSGLITARVDEDINIKAFWDRCHRLTDGGGKKYKDGEAIIHDWMQADYINDYQIRTEFPLPEFVPFADALCENVDFPSLPYFSGGVGLPSINWETERELTPGFKCGDPCEFGLVNFKKCNSYNLKNIDKKLLEDMKLGFAVTNSFTWLLGQAYYQGFHYLCDITYPLATQTVLTDGKAFSFYAYQLNTIELGKEDQSNPYQNLCWYKREQNLYEKVEDGKVIGLNDDVCKTILKFLLRKTKNRGINMKPTLPLSYMEMIEVEPTHIGREGLPDEKIEEVEPVRKSGDYDV